SPTIYSPIPEVVGSTAIFSPGYMTGSNVYDLPFLNVAAPVSIAYAGATSNLLDIVMNAGGDAKEPEPVWAYDATITPTTGLVGTGTLTKFGGQRLDIQGPGTYTGSVVVAGGVLNDENDTGLGT